MCWFKCRYDFSRTGVEGGEICISKRLAGDAELVVAGPQLASGCQCVAGTVSCPGWLLVKGGRCGAPLQ